MLHLGADSEPNMNHFPPYEAVQSERLGPIHRPLHGFSKSYTRSGIPTFNHNIGKLGMSNVINHCTIVRGGRR